MFTKNKSCVGRSYATNDKFVLKCSNYLVTKKGKNLMLALDGSAIVLSSEYFWNY